jgi:hypothetical protein
MESISSGVQDLSWTPDDDNNKFLKNFSQTPNFSFAGVQTLVWQDSKEDSTRR